MYRPEGWPKCPCDDCTAKAVDEWGYLCDWACQQRTQWLWGEFGADAMLKELCTPDRHMDNRTDDERYFYGKKGYLVFIPEE